MNYIASLLLFSLPVALSLPQLVDGKVVAVDPVAVRLFAGYHSVGLGDDVFYC